MESLYLLIPIAIVIVAIAVAVFFWAVKSGQYDDLDTESRRILFDDPPEPSSTPELSSTPKPSANTKPADDSLDENKRDD